MSQKKNYLYKVGRQSAADYFFLLGHCERLEVLETLRRFGPTSFRGLLLNSPLSQGSLSRHILQLKGAGLVEPCQLGSDSGYQLNEVGVRHALQTMQGYLSALDFGKECLKAA